MDIKELITKEMVQNTIQKDVIPYVIMVLRSEADDIIKECLDDFKGEIESIIQNFKDDFLSDYESNFQKEALDYCKNNLTPQKISQLNKTGILDDYLCEIIQEYIESVLDEWISLNINVNNKKSVKVSTKGRL